jgi:hypothetical protein
MSRWCDHFAITKEYADRLLYASASEEEPDAAVLEVLREVLDDPRAHPPHVEVDKIWEPVHRCLTGDHGPGGRLNFDAGAYPLKLCLLGGEWLWDDFLQGHRSVQLVSPEEVEAVVEALQQIDATWLSDRFFALPDDQFHELNDGVFACTWAYFEELRAFFVQAAAERKAVICTISH